MIEGGDAEDLALRQAQGAGDVMEDFLAQKAVGVLSHVQNLDEGIRLMTGSPNRPLHLPQARIDRLSMFHWFPFRHGFSSFFTGRGTRRQEAAGQFRPTKVMEKRPFSTGGR